MSEIARLSARQQRALESLLAGASVTAVAQALGVNVKTIWRWRQEPAFNLAMASARSDSFEQTIAALNNLGPRAIVMLTSCMRLDAPQSVRLRASAIVLEAITRLNDADVMRRLYALEARLEGTSNEA